MLGLDSRGGASVVSRSTRDRLSAWLPSSARASRPRTLDVSLAQLAGDAIGAGRLDAPIPPPQDYGQLERKYGTSAPVYVCVRRKARDLSSAPLRVERELKDGTFEPAPKDDPLATLLRQPNPWMTGAQLVYYASVFLDLTGNFFLLILRDRRGVARQLYPVNPMAVTIYGSPARPVASYELFHFGSPQPLRAYGLGEPGDMLHFKLASPIPQSGSYDAAFPSPWGFGPLEATWELVVTDGDATRWNRNLVKNEARPVGMLTTDSTINKEIADEAKARWLDNYAGPGKAGAIAVMGSGMKYTQLSFAPKDMDYLPASRELWRRIFAAFDVNETVLGFTSGDVGRRDEQVKDYWRGTIIATSAADICPVFEPLAREFGDSYVVTQDFSKVRALAPDWAGLASAVGMVLDRGMPMKVANEVFELDVPEYPGWDRGYVSAGAVPVDPETGAPMAGPGLPPAPGDELPFGAPPPERVPPEPPGDEPIDDDEGEGEEEGDEEVEAGEEIPEDVEKALAAIEARVRRVVREELEARP